MIFALADLKVPLPTSNPMLAELHDRFAGDYLRQFDHAQTSFRAREVILKRLPDGEPRRDQVAAELHTSERTLQRRLVEEATSFLQLLDDTRREPAEQVPWEVALVAGAGGVLTGLRRSEHFFQGVQAVVRAVAGAV
jgi:AraC-like DNA-binding protein